MQLLSFLSVLIAVPTAFATLPEITTKKWLDIDGLPTKMTPNHGYNMGISKAAIAAGVDPSTLKITVSGQYGNEKAFFSLEHPRGKNEYAAQIRFGMDQTKIPKLLYMKFEAQDGEGVHYQRQHFTVK
eukprot:Gregarina_sp_Pseudo_9__3091@NODE_3289_length_690_cov_5174_199693_g2439_i1_p1_GENE_NODE_3289_length_690_cov_5174_199693_g2439_i1NODE_3289_length_690_cov_5174_199693_g2439_i1_p1_ORF_typecomplete_len128_score11_43_NODE_3289_length_690_cov_5174_199693_g2439_i169452